MSSLLEFAIARTSSPYARPVAQLKIEDFNMAVIFDNENKSYFIVNPYDLNSYIRIPDNFTIGNTITWFYNSYCAPLTNFDLNYLIPSFTLHKRVGNRLYPMRTLHRLNSLGVLKAKWHELSPNPIIGSLNFKQ